MIEGLNQRVDHRKPRPSCHPIQDIVGPLEGYQTHQDQDRVSLWDESIPEVQERENVLLGDRLSTRSIAVGNFLKNPPADN